MSGLTQEQLDRLHSSAVDRSNKTSESSVRSTVSIVYVPDGITKFRPYADKEGEVIRTGFRHKFGKNSIQCLGPPICKVCNRLKEISDSWDGSWRFGSQEFALMYAWIFECSDNQNQYIKLNEPVILMGNARLANEVSYQIKEIPLEDLASTFLPEEPSLMWQLRFDRDKKNLSLGFFSRKATMDPLPESFAPLSQSYLKAGVPPSADKEADFLKEMEVNFARFLSISGSESSAPRQTYNPPPQAAPPVKEPAATPAKEQVAPPTPVKEQAAPKPAEFNGQRTPSKTAGEIPQCFGFHDNNYENPDCLLCKAESKCEIETNKKTF